MYLNTLGDPPVSWQYQLYWPLGWWVSLDAVREDPDILREVLWAAVAILAAVVLVALAVHARRRRVPALLVLGAALWSGSPHLRPLLIPAGPYFFFKAPARAGAAAIADGARLYPEHCAACHGAAGRGDGPQAAGLPVPPADLTAPHLWMHSDGQLFGWLTDGMAAPDGSPAMPGFAAALTPDQRWHLIDFIRARNTARICKPQSTSALAPTFDAATNAN